MDWFVEPEQPVIRGLSRAVAVRWQAATSMRLHRTSSWGSSPRAAVGASSSWGGTLASHSSVVSGWGASPTIAASTFSSWCGLIRDARRMMPFKWGAMGRSRRSLEAAWNSSLGRLGIGLALGWRQLFSVWGGAFLPWDTSSSRIAPSFRGAWSHPGLARLHRRLPWGSAGRVKWGVRPVVPPGPDPETPFAPGDRIPLNLGCDLVREPGRAPLNLGVTACYVVRPHRRTYVVINTVSLVRLPDRTPIEVTRISLSSSRGTWGWTFDIELADPQQLALLKPTAAGPRQFEINLNGYVWTGIIESFQKQREFSGGGVRLSGRSRTALLAAPYAPARVKATTEERSVAQLVAEELADTGFTSHYDTVDWTVPAGAWFYDASTPLDAISALAEASGGVVQSDPSALAMRVRAAYPASPWDWRTTPPDHVLQEDIVLTESLQMRSAPLYDAVVVTGELAGKGVTCKVRRSGEEGRLYAQQVSSPLITVPAAGAERGRNILCDRGEQAAVDLTVPLFAEPLNAGEIGLMLPLDLVEVVGADGTWHGQCESLRIEVSADDRAVVIEQTVTLERHYTDAD
ncbi:hypothetical protein JY464_06890 [Stenotrophomonas maltophilia]|nr:hypothetical protein [Stenotrophomonas maltophilia]